MEEKPLVWTSKGNLPVEDLEYSVQWEDTKDYVKMIETYTLNGEIVKQSMHGMIRQPAESTTEQGGF